LKNKFIFMSKQGELSFSQVLNPKEKDNKHRIPPLKLQRDLNPSKLRHTSFDEDSIKLDPRTYLHPSMSQRYGKAAGQSSELT
jgi:hypothetical protein